MASLGQPRFFWVRDKRYPPYFWQQFFPSHIWWFLLPMIVARHMRKHWLWVSHRRRGNCTWLLTTFMRGQPPSIVFSFLWSRNCFHAVLLKHTASPSPGAPCSGRQITIAAFSAGFFTSSSSSSSSASWASSARYWGGQSTGRIHFSLTTAYSVLLIGCTVRSSNYWESFTRCWWEINFHGWILSKQNKLGACFPWAQAFMGASPRRRRWLDSRCGAL